MIQKPVLPKNWVAVGFSQDLKKGANKHCHYRRIGTGFFGEIIKAKCTPRDNRCPHRGTRLSLGFFSGKQLACLYHGWQLEGMANVYYSFPSRVLLPLSLSKLIPIVALNF
ncbi:MAG: hypothetical protein Ct9H90mP8_2260 [Pseudomonadota bacterium]|nr:MAG: hypothetical protein Ct9H90mP8_2260 [Pseudomonadota bacterium]